MGTKMYEIFLTVDFREFNLSCGCGHETVFGEQGETRSRVRLEALLAGSYD